VKSYAIEAEVAVEADVEAAFDWYEAEEADLGFEFPAGASRYLPTNPRRTFWISGIASGIRRALTRRFPYAVYFSIEGETIVVVAVLHTARDPAEWQRRI